MSRIAVHAPAKPGTSRDNNRESNPTTSTTVVENTGLPPLRQLALANFFVAAKSCRRLILAGPSGSGKLALARLVSELLGGDTRMKAMVGHARWAAGSAQSAMLVEAQTRLNKNALFGLIEEAWLPEQQDRPFVACLERISPAEIDSFFTPEGLNLLYHQFLGWRATKGLPQLPLPPNLTLIATLDTERFRWWDTSLAGSVLVVPWPASAFRASSRPWAWERPGLCSGSFLRDSIREPGPAHARLRQLLPPTATPFERLLQVANALEEAGLSVPRAVMNRVTVFAANAWNRTDAGIFSLEPLATFDCALQLGIIQHVLPWLAATRQPTDIHSRVLTFLDDAYEPLVTLLVGSKAA